MLTPHMFWALIAPSVRATGRGKKKIPQRERRPFIQNNLQTERRIDKYGGLDEVSHSRRDLAL